jgi:DNA-binding transcriptional MocR family regulator
MTISSESVARRSGPRYRAIADEVAARIDAGELGPGARLPTHRDLAGTLGVTVGTVTRAYSDLERRGLVRGEVGRGTFVGGRPDDLGALTEGPGDGSIDLGRNYPAPGVQVADLRRTLRALAGDPRLGRVMEYQEHEGRPEHRAAGADWIRRTGYDVPAERVVVIAGAQHGLLVALSAACAPGERIGVEALAFPGTKAVARMIGCRLEPLEMDGEGMLPAAVDAACRGGVRVICCVPSLNNPTNAVMSEERRREIAAVVRERGAIVVEDDIFGLLLEEPLPPLASFAPENAIYLTSLSKTLAPGLRIGYLVAPPALAERAHAAVRATCWMAPPLPAEIATRWIEDGTADRILARQKREASARLDLAREILGAWGADGPRGTMHVWFRLPEPWTPEAFAAAARAGGVTLSTEAPFVVRGAERPRALRICLGTPATRDVLETALRRLAGILEEGGRSPSDLSIV